MEAIREINGKITCITILIKSKYPSLLNYLNEMQITIPEEDPEKSIENLQAYYDSLSTILRDYTDRKG
ncbi:MAG: hypothetical protein ABIP51_18925 [Bacteroidia bacterium]